MKFATLLILAAIALPLAGCQTMQGLQQDVSTIGTKIGNSVANLRQGDEAEEGIEETIGQTNSAPVTLATEGCPTIMIDPQFDSMSEFYDMENPTPANEVSTITLSQTQTNCNVEGEFLNMRIDLIFDGELGPKAKRKESDRPFFAYPYFIAVQDAAGQELARELFAASVTYTKDQDQIQLMESIRQKLPLNEDGSIPAYQIIIGFQLSEDQLFYNASQN